MRWLSIGAGKIVKKKIVRMLALETRKSSFVRCTNGKMRNLRFLKQTIFSTLNTFSRQCSEKGSSYEPMVDFSKSGNKERLAGLFNESGQPSTLEASVFDAIDNLSPFLGAIVDSICAPYHSTEVTESSIEYADTVNFSFKCHCIVEWTEEALQHLKSCIRSLNKKGRFGLCRYWTSRMLAQK